MGEANIEKREPEGKALIVGFEAEEEKGWDTKDPRLARKSLRIGIINASLCMPDKSEHAPRFCLAGEQKARNAFNGTDIVVRFARWFFKIQLIHSSDLIGYIPGGACSQ